jgi:hypothetical protein
MTATSGIGLVRGHLCFKTHLVFSVLRQFKIVKPTRQPGEKTNKLLKTKLSLHIVWTWNNKSLIYFIYQQRKYSRKSIDKIIKRTVENITTPLHSQYNLKVKIPWKDVFCRYFLLFVLQLLLFKTYPHADAKQRKTKKWPW